MHASPRVIAALETWARWARDGRAGSAQCRSAEGLYKAERLRGDEEADRREAREPLDVRRALATYERINPTAGFPTELYLALTGEFIFRLQPWQLRGYLRRHGFDVGKGDVDALVKRAVAEAARRLERG